MSEERNLLRDIVAVLFLIAAAFLAVSLLTYHPADPIPAQIGPLSSLYQHDPVVLPASQHAANACGTWGSLTANIFHCYFGLASFYIVASLVGVAVWMFRQPYIGSPVLRTAGWFFSLIGVAALASLLLPQISAGPVIGGGGYLGAIGSLLLGKQFAMAGCAILATSFSIAGFMIFSDETLFTSIRWVFVAAFGGLIAAREMAMGINDKRVKWRTDPAMNSEADAEEGDAQQLVDATSETDALEADETEAEEDAPYTIRIQGRTELYDDAKAEAEGELGDEAEFESEYEGEFDEAEAYDEEFDEDEEYEEGEFEDEEEVAEGDSDEVAVVAPTKNNLPVSSKPHFDLKEKEEEPDPRKDVMNALDKASLTQKETDYAMPDIRLLQNGTGPSFEEQEKEVRHKAAILTKTFREFGFDVKVTGIETGPVIAQYEIELEAGLRLSKITGLADDIAIALRVPSVRIVAPIPGKCTVGIEVPNENRQMVCLRDVIEESRKETEKMHIPIFLGKDVSGKALVADLAKLPHLLIAGRTGTGKSVCLNAIITSILMTRRPEDVRMLMIDPKMVELSGYGRLPHLMHPVVTDMRKAEAILAWAVDKMEERYQLLARAGVRHLTTYNQLGEEELWERLQIESEDEKLTIPTSLPFIVIVADEMADLMMTAGKEVEQHIIRIAQKSRAVGIHLILATQKPTVDVITGLIKSNLPSRIAFQVASKTDSRVVLDENGADKLLGNGDMLFLGNGDGLLMRGQGTFVSDDEIDMITDKVSTNEQEFAPELMNLKMEGADDESAEAAPLKDRDDRYEEAIGVIVNEGRGSLSLLQRAMGIGYGRAARLIDFMAEDGIVGSYNGSKSREVLISSEDWARMQSGGAAADDSDDDDDDFDPPPEPPRPTKPKKPSLKAKKAASPSVSFVPSATEFVESTVSNIANDVSDEVAESDVAESDVAEPEEIEDEDEMVASIPATAFEIVNDDSDDDLEEYDEEDYEEDIYAENDAEKVEAEDDEYEYEEVDAEEDGEIAAEAETDEVVDDEEYEDDVEYEYVDEADDAADEDEVEYDASDEDESVAAPSLYVEADDDQYEDYDDENDDEIDDESYEESA